MSPVNSVAEAGDLLERVEAHFSRMTAATDAALHEAIRPVTPEVLLHIATSALTRLSGVLATSHDEPMAQHIDTAGLALGAAGHLMRIRQMKELGR